MITVDTLIKITLTSYTHLSPSAEKITKDVLAFLATRATFYFKDQGFSHGVIKACMPEDDTNLNITAAFLKMTALHQLLGTDTGAALLAGYKRAANIFRAESSKDTSEDYTLMPDLFQKDVEKNLFEALDNITSKWHDTVSDHEKCALLASLKEPIDAFFNEVMVNDSDPVMRSNRLALLHRIIRCFECFARFQELD